MQNENTKAAADLRAAANEIRRRGWHQGHLIDSDGRKVCAVGGMMSAVGDGVIESVWPPTKAQRLRNARAAFAAANELWNPAWSSRRPHNVAKDLIVAWNDAEDRVVDDVLNAFEKAALWAEEQA
jgi:hypothetical protein